MDNDDFSPTEDSEATQDTSYFERDVDYPMELCRALWRKRNGLIIELMHSSKRLELFKQMRTRKKIAISGDTVHSVPFQALSRAPALIKVPEQEKVLMRRMMQNNKDITKSFVTQAADLIMRHLIRTEREKVDPLDLCLLAFFVCQKLSLRLPWDELPSDCFDELPSPETQQALLEVLNATSQHLRVLYVLITLNDEFLHYYCLCYEQLFDGIFYDLDDRVESIRTINNELFQFLHYRHRLKPEFRKAQKECQALHAIDHIVAFEPYLKHRERFVLNVLDSYKEIVEEIGRHYEALLPRKFNAQEVLSLLSAVQPPLDDSDMATASAEIEKISKKELSSQNSALLRYILPILYEEATFSYADLQKELLGGYSFLFIARLLDGQCTIPAILLPKKDLRTSKSTENETSAQQKAFKKEAQSPQNAKRSNKKDAVKTQPKEEETEQQEDTTSLLVQQDQDEKEASTPKEPTSAADTKNPKEDAQEPSSLKEPCPTEPNEEKEVVREEETKRTETEDLKATKENLSKPHEPPTPKVDETPQNSADIEKDAEKPLSKETQHKGAPSTLSKPSAPLGLLESKLQDEQEAKETSIPEKKVQPKAEPASLSINEPPLAERLNHCYVFLIMHADTQALYWLCQSGEGANTSANLCPPWLAEILHYGLHMRPGFTAANNRLAELTSLAATHMESLNDRQCLLLAAAILRPSLLVPVLDLATIASSLALRLSKYACTTFLQRLNQFITHGKAIDASLLVEQRTDSQRKMQFQALKEKTMNFLQRSKTGRLPDQSAIRIRNEILGENGCFGKLFMRCMNEDFTELEEGIATNTDLDRLIDTNRFYPSTKKISEFPRKKLFECLKEALNLLQSWASFHQSTQSLRSDERSYMLDTYVGLFANLDEALAKMADVVEGQLLARELTILRSCPAEPLPEEPCDAKTQLELWPFTIPLVRDAQGGWPVAELINFLMSPTYEQKTDIVQSLALHMAEGEMIGTANYLEQYPEVKDALLNLEEHPISKAPKGLPQTLSLQAFFNHCQEHFATTFTKSVKKVRDIISEYSFRSIIHFQQQSQYNSRLENIVSTYGTSKQDMARGLTELSAIEAELNQCEEEKKQEVQNRINELLAETDISSEARDRLENVCQQHLEQGMYSAAYADIVDVEENLSKGKPLRNLAQSQPSEAKAARDFYASLQKGSTSEEILVPIWDKAKRTLRNKPLASEKGRTADSRDVGIVTELLRWLGFTLDQNEQAKSIYSAGRPNFWRVIQYRMEIAGPLPHFGSRQSTHTIAFGWDTQPEDINQLFNSSHFAPDDAVTVLCFSQFDQQARQKLLSFCASRHMAPLIIDTNLVNFLSAYEGTMRTEILFRVALAGAAINPYMPDIAGSVPKEMFFGRKDDIRAVMAKEGPCILYGGRQLGKSALLQQIYKGQTPQMVVLLHSMRPFETSLLDAALLELRKAQLIAPQTTQNTFADNILQWLSANPGKRILLLLDECDRALEYDAQKDFGDCVVFRNLMQESERSFKVVLTGLHSVQRFSQYPNNPLYHFGEPLCIGPLSPEAANALMCEPTSLLGLELNEQMVQIALNHCNYQPKLIQIFCSELVQALNERPNRGPFHSIDKDTFVRIYESHNLKKKILECFEMTLNLDERYLVIGYTMAISHGHGYSLNELLHELKIYWPAAFGGAQNIGEPTSDVSNTLRSLLHEMEGLGLIISLGGKYRLRTPNVVELLGGEDSIYARLDPYQNKEYRPSGNPEELRLPGVEPLVAAQYNLLCEKKTGLIWISGSNALGLQSVPRVLEHLAEDSKLHLCKLEGPTADETLRTIRQTYEEVASGGLLFWLWADTLNEMADFIQKADAWLTKLHAKNKYVKIIVLVDPTSLFDWMQQGLTELYSSYQIELQPWSLDGIEGWCKEKVLPGIDPKETLEKTGGWTFLVEEVLTKQATLSLEKLTTANFCMPKNEEQRSLLKRYAEELGSESFSIEDVWQWLYGILPEADNIQTMLNTWQSLKILRPKGNQLILEPVLCKVLEGEAQ